MIRNSKFLSSLTVLAVLLLWGISNQSGAANASHLPSYLDQLAQEEPESIVRVIVQTNGALGAVQHRVIELGGKIEHNLELIQGFSAEMPARAARLLATEKQVRQVSLDLPVYSSSTTDGSQTNSRDDFDSMDFQGDNGGNPWLTPWQEIGEADGAQLGDVAVTEFWGGALHGLRIQQSSKGASRTLNLQDATNATLTFGYRRKDFVESDAILVEVSADGGASWSTLASLTGPITDSDIQFADYDLSGYLTRQTMLRFVSSGDMSDVARFYLDFVDVQATFPPDAAFAPRRLFLPLVSSQGESAAQDKATVVNNDSVSAAAVCNYRCFDLTQLGSNYVKAIRADQLWNVSPYLRGDGVVVAIVDSGITAHPDLNDYNGTSRLIAQVNFAEGASTPDDYYGHGTHIAGIIGGLGTRSNGAYMGVAPEVKFVDVKVINDYGYGSTADVVAGLQWVYENRATYNIKVANLSLNSSAPEAYLFSPLDAAVEILWFNKIVTVVSSGNKGSQHLYAPGNDPFAITVGALDDKGSASLTDDVLATFSAFGITESSISKPDLLAPGANIISILASDDSNLARDHSANVVTAATGYNYFKMSGTSMAAAVTSGAVALLLEDEPSLTPDQVKNRLKTTARSVNGSAACSTGSGALDIYAAVYGTSTSNANTGIRVSQLLGTGSKLLTWNSVNWNSVNWNSVNWNSVNWNSVNWNSYSGSVVWDSGIWDWLSGATTSKICSGVTSFILVNASTEQDIQPIYPGAILDLRTIGTSNLNVRADVAGAKDGIDFDLDNGSYTPRDLALPYSLFGDILGFYSTGQFTMGSHTLEGTPYKSGLLTKSEGNPMTVSFRVGTSLQVVHSNKCFDVKGASKADGASLIQFSCQGKANQLFELRSVAGKSNTYNLVSSNSNKCVEIADASTTDGANVVQRSCSSATSQQFQLRAVSGKANTYQLVAVHSSKCLDVKGAAQEDSTPVIQWSCSTSTNQQWRLIK